MALARPAGLVDLQFCPLRPVEKWSSLGRPLTDAPEQAPVSRFLRDHTAEGDSVLHFGVCSQVLFFSGRRCAGDCVCYAPGLLATPDWQRRHLAGVERDRPRYVVCEDGLLVDGRPETALPLVQPALWRYIESRYPRVVYRRGWLVVRARQEPTDDEPE